VDMAIVKLADAIDPSDCIWDSGDAVFNILLAKVYNENALLLYSQRQP
jgi:hypothetical protein